MNWLFVAFDYITIQNKFYNLLNKYVSIFYRIETVYKKKNIPDITEKIKTPWKRKSRAKPKASLAKMETMPTSSASLDGDNGGKNEYEINENMEIDPHESPDNYDKDFLCELNNNQVIEPDEYVAEYE